MAATGCRLARSQNDDVSLYEEGPWKVHHIAVSYCGLKINTGGMRAVDVGIVLRFPVTFLFPFFKEIEDPLDTGLHFVTVKATVPQCEQYVEGSQQRKHQHFQD